MTNCKCILEYLQVCTCKICIFLYLHVLQNNKIINNKFLICKVCKLKITKLQMKDEILQPTNNNVSKFTSNKTHVIIAQNYKLQVTKLQVYNLQVCKIISYKII